ncbi:MAG TPA: glycosyltransferase family 2 protein [Terriglobia bacterium]|nr:glycosyltransferase family 2 protein [Terriglobia bacterium]
MSTPPDASISVSAFFPALNDAENLRVQVPRTFETLGQLTTDFEVIVVDDGSTDATPQVLDSLGQQFPALRVVRHSQNRGYGAALQSGFNHAVKDLVFYTDGDCQYDVRELGTLLEKLTSDVDVVTGFKKSRSDSAHRVVLGDLYHRFVKTIFRLKVRDVDCDFRLIRRRVLDTISLTSHTGAICVDLMCQIERHGYRVVEVPVSHFPRLHGHSQFFRVVPVVRTMVDIIRLWVQLILFKRALPPRGTSHSAQGVR